MKTPCVYHVARDRVALVSPSIEQAQRMAVLLGRGFVARYIERPWLVKLVKKEARRA